MLEKTFQKNVKKYLKDKGCYVLNNIASKGSESGAPDLSCCIGGIYVGLELKVKHTPTNQQIIHLKNIRKASGVGIIFTYTKDWKLQLDKLIRLILNLSILGDFDNELNELWPLPEVKWD